MLYQSNLYLFIYIYTQFPYTNLYTIKQNATNVTYLIYVIVYKTIKVVLCRGKAIVSWAKIKTMSNLTSGRFCFSIKSAFFKYHFKMAHETGALSLKQVLKMAGLSQKTLKIPPTSQTVSVNCLFGVFHPTRYIFYSCCLHLVVGLQTKQCPLNIF